MDNAHYPQDEAPRLRIESRYAQALRTYSTGDRKLGDYIFVDHKFDTAEAYRRSQWLDYERVMYQALGEEHWTDWITKTLREQLDDVAIIIGHVPEGSLRDLPVIGDSHMGRLNDPVLMVDESVLLGRGFDRTLVVTQLKARSVKSDHKTMVYEMGRLLEREMAPMSDYYPNSNRPSAEQRREWRREMVRRKKRPRK